MGISAVRMRILRAAFFTALVVTLSAASHVLLSSAPVPLSTVAVLCAAVFAVAYALAGEREHGPGRIAATLIPLELAADTVFTTGQNTCYGQAGGPVTGPLRSVGVDLLCGYGDVGAPLAGMTGGDQVLLRLPVSASTPWLLLAAHIGVGLLAALWLRGGEAALAGLLRTAAALAFRPLRLAAAAAGGAGAAPPRHAVPAAARPVDTARDRLLAHCVGRRGPPVCSAPAPAGA
ncbi:hypothetical protein [Streptomyces sp. GC420]|uniref:hypothetical protein n=1 Tax=Streptomyces sp. GC420 TaxID=2697568 RepID=UPI00141530BF|nr:hypothetical protein [Streptomyces sp. GC420]NBM16278.1 hypothetical protein [Streptomyces sp. GC420]